MVLHQVSLARNKEHMRNGASIRSYLTTYLLQFVYHVFNANICSLQHFAFHLYQPGAQLLILLIEHDPGIEPILDLLLPQGHL